VILGSDGNQQVSPELMRKAGALTIGQAIYQATVVRALQDFTDEELVEALPKLAARAIQAAAVYVALAEHSMKPTHTGPK
jgi:hypothetical protein